jgi:hypothetical protein
MSKVIQRTKVCECGSDLYVAELEIVRDSEDNALRFPRVWECANCHKHTPRQTKNRRTNAHRAFEAWQQLKAEWVPVDAALAEMVLAGQPSGIEVVHGHFTNYHLDKLLTAKKLSNWDVRYHITAARADLKRAQEFVARYNRVAYA